MKGKLETEHPEWIDNSPYSSHIIVFLDVLGFSQLVNNPKMNSVFAGLYASISGFSEIVKNNEQADLSGIKTTVLSDSIVLSYPADTPNVLEKLTRMMHSIMHTFADENVFLRGSITKGLLWHDKNIVFGPGLVRAHELEKNKADNPRCIVDPEVLDELFNCDEGYPVHISFTEDEDGFVYYDYYLNQLYSDRNVNYNTRTITRIREAIILNLKSGHCDKVHRKYLWCAAHFNYAVIEVGRITENNQESLLIIEGVDY